MVVTSAWQQAQAHELAWHQANPWRADGKLFADDTRRLMEGFGFHSGNYSSVIDAGAGPRLRSAFFTTAALYAIEPLADEYLKLDWCDLHRATLYAEPLEDFIPDLYADFLMCINVLDHVQDFGKCICNMAKYAPVLFLSYDIGQADKMHPLELTEAWSESMFVQCGLKIVRKTTSDPYRAGYAVNYWLSHV